MSGGMPFPAQVAETTGTVEKCVSVRNVFGKGGATVGISTDCRARGWCFNVLTPLKRMKDGTVSYKKGYHRLRINTRLKHVV